MNTKRRTFLKVLGTGAASALASGPLFRAFGQAANASREHFIFIFASGGWDVTLWSDPRNEAKGLVAPATSSLVDITGISEWRAAANNSFQLVQKNGYALGPTVGPLLPIFNRATLINGVAMNTTSHDDGTYFSSTGRHLAGSRPAG